MPKLNPVSGKKMIKILEALGFSLQRVKGSHYFFLNLKTGKTATVPVHKNEDLGPGLIRSILRDIELNLEEYEKLRKQIWLTDTQGISGVRRKGLEIF